MVSLDQLFKVKVSSKGQIVIPKPIREFYHIKEGDEILIIPTERGVLIKRKEETTGLRGLLKDLEVDVEELESILAEAKKSLTKLI
ncbi:MAG: AbrB/MazE/SpoVT family DNA-binding domain-containing protein [Candidatus Freyarchaeota archaeon]